MWLGRIYLTSVGRALGALYLAPGHMAMDPDDITQIVVLMASLPDTHNLLEALTLPLGMPFLGRG